MSVATAFATAKTASSCDPRSVAAFTRRRISKRRVQTAWCAWQEAAGFDWHYPFHCLRHTAVTTVYRSSRDLFLAQRFARHASPLTTIVYTHPSDDELRRSVRVLSC